MTQYNLSLRCVIKGLSCTMYSKTCFKRLLKNRQNLDLNEKW